ncbi:hypothetical protein PG994_012578 [Apiospora phragmitis]|uniref:Uncharacterized protein n=1 Tax=Apiospora phragmitis TaxID=2905665 RepID=A0ABR1TAV2_9PEZI
MYYPNTTWTRMFMLLALVQCVGALFLETYVVLTVEDHLPHEAMQVPSGHTVPMYASLFIFGFAYELLLFWDSLRLHSMIQVVGLCIYNLLLTLYAIFQPRQIRDALDRLSTSFIMGDPKRPILDPDSPVWQEIKPALFALIWVLAVGTAVMCFLAYKLHAEFAWLVYKVIHADIKMRRRVLTLEINVALVKFNFFFILGFLIQNIVDSRTTVNPEFGMTIAGTFIAWSVAVSGIICARRENKKGTAVVIFVYCGGVAYLVYKVLKLLKKPDYYMLTIFACITLFMLVCTIIAAILCFANYDKGLKSYGEAKTRDIHSRNPSENPILLQHTAYGVRPFLPHRMTID